MKKVRPPNMPHEPVCEWVVTVTGRTIGCYLVRWAYEHPANRHHSISGSQEPPHTSQVGLHPDIGQLCQER